MNAPRITLTPRRVLLGATLLVAVTAGGFAIADDSAAEPRRDPPVAAPADEADRPEPDAPDTPAVPEPDGGDAPDTPLPDEPDTPVSDAPESPAAPEAPAAPLPDGRHFGRIPGAYVAPNEMVFDAQELIPGDTEDGAYTIRDISDENVSLPVAEDVVVTVVSCESFCVEGSPSTYDSLTLSVQPSDAYSITVENGVVVRIDQRYLA